MMGTILKFPLTQQELQALGSEPIVRFPASFQEYWELLGKAEYKADFIADQIIAMSYESHIHSKITANMMILLSKLFDQKAFSIHTPNRPVYIAEAGAIHHPDTCVTPEPAPLFEYQNGMNAETAPVLLVEVLSKSTRDYDYAEKLPNYKRIPGLKQIIYIESQRPFITIWERDNDGNRWQNTDYASMELSFMINGQTVSLEEVYQRVVFV